MVSLVRRGNETLEENFPFGVTVVVFVASTEATEPLKGFRVLSLLPETHHGTYTLHVARILFASRLRVVRINPSLLRFDVYQRKACFFETIIKIPSFFLLFFFSFQQSFDQHPRIFSFFSKLRDLDILYPPIINTVTGKNCINNDSFVI